jgi:putative tryptophan/tyrosine transport system substrate-binding protein
VRTRRELAIVRCRALAVSLALVIAAGCANASSAGSQVYTLAFLRAVPPSAGTDAALLDELRQAGFVRGRNLRMLSTERGGVYPDPDEARAAVAEWRAEGVDLIVAFSTVGATLARSEAPDADVLFVSNDPVATGLVTDEAAPDDRMTGFAFRVPGDRLIDLARRTIPDLQQLGLAHPRDDPAAVANRDALQAAADDLGVTLLVEPYDDEDGASVRSAVARLADRGADALMVSNTPAAFRLLEPLRQEAAEQRLAVVAGSGLVDFAVLSLAPDSEEMGRQLGRQAVRLLSGTPAHAIPVEGPRRFVLRLNATVAAELGVDIPDDVLREAQAVT